MLAILFTITVFLAFVILLRGICRNHISARLQYAVWLLVVVKLLVFPVPNIEGNFSVLRLVPGLQEIYLDGEGLSENKETDKNVQMAAESTLTIEEKGTAENNPANGIDTAAGTDKNTETAFIEGMDNSGSKASADSANASSEKMSKIPWTVRLQHFAADTLHVPFWMFMVMAAGSVLSAIYITGCHLRLRNYLKKNGKPLTEVSEIRELFPERRNGEWAGRKPLPAYRIKGLPTPCLFGRTIYIPERLSEDKEMLPYVLAHETCHYYHGDTLWGFVRIVCICLYWYHPLVWLAAYLSRQDCELACDEAVTGKMEGEKKKRYGELLLELALVKSMPTDCFSITTTMSGNARNLKHRLERITGKRKNVFCLGGVVVVLLFAGITTCVISGFVSPENQWEAIEIQVRENIPLQESYTINWEFSEDAASYALYLEQYEYGKLTSTDILECESLGAPENRRTKKGESLWSRSIESDAADGTYIKAGTSYSMPDITEEQDGATSYFKAFTIELPEGCIGNSFSGNSQEKQQHRFRLDEDVILWADYYGDAGGLHIPGEHSFEADAYQEFADNVMKYDKCVILTRLIVSDKNVDELRRQLEEKFGGSQTKEGGEADEAGAGDFAKTGTYTNEELTELARNYYRELYGFAPSYVEVDHEEGDMVTLWLYDMNEFLNENGEIAGSANTRDWYTIDRTTGKGEDVNFNEVDLSKAHLLSEKWDGSFDAGKVVDAREQMNSMEFPTTPEAGTEDRIYFLGETGHYTLYGFGDYQSMLLYDGSGYTQIFQPFVIDTITNVPEIEEADYDGDGEAELAIKLLWGRGTGIWQEKLWIVDREAEGINVYEYFDGAYASELLSHLSWGMEENGVRILADGKTASPLLGNGSSAAYDEMGIDTGNVTFSFTGEKIHIRAKIACGRMESSVMPAYYDGYLRAEVDYRGNGEFGLKEIFAGNQLAEETAADAVRQFYAPDTIEIVDYQYDMSELINGELEMTVVLFGAEEDSLEYAAMTMKPETDIWQAGEIWIEK